MTTSKLFVKFFFFLKNLKKTGKINLRGYNVIEGYVFLSR